jgi:hemoglobin-like flavoprotein
MSGTAMTSPSPSIADSNAEASYNDSAEQSLAEEELFERRKRTIQSSWNAVRIGLDVKASKLFYDRLFDKYPCVRPMFKKDMTLQYNKLFQAVSLAVRFLDNVEELVPVLQELGVRHAGYGVVRAHYEAVTECFLWTLNTYIVSQMPNNNAIHWLFDITDAWEWALTFIGGIMADAADEAIAAKRKAGLERQLADAA